MSGQVAPHDLDTEQALIGACLLHPAMIDDATLILGADDFYHPQHAHTWHAMCRLHGDNQPVDIITVADELRSQGVHTGDSTEAALLAIQTNAGGSRSVPRYATIVAALARTRRLAQLCGDITERCYQRQGEPDDILDWAQQAVYELGTARRNIAEPTSMDTAIDAYIAELAAGPDNRTFIPTGLHELDRLVVGFRPGQLITVAGRPGMGKSLAGAQIGLHAAMHAHPTMFVTIEMSILELVERLVGSHSQINLNRLRSRNVSEKDWAHINPSAAKLKQTPLYLLDDPNASVATIRAQARRLQARHGLDMIIVDYLQLMTSATAKKDSNRQVEVAEMSAGLKRLARDLGVPVIALAQLNRGLEVRSDKRPLLSDLRESGAIENDSDIVISIYRDDYYDEGSPDRGTAELAVLKQRNGPTGKAIVGYHAEHGQFVNLTHQLQETA